MIDIQFIRDNPDQVAEKSQQKGYKIDIGRLVELDKKDRELDYQIQQLAAQSNEIAKGIQGPPRPEVIEQGKRLAKKPDSSRVKPVASSNTKYNSRWYAARRRGK